MSRHLNIESVGGAAYLSRVVNAVPNAAHANYYAEIVREKATFRSLIYAATEILRDAYAKALADPQVRERLVSTGQDPIGDPPEAFAATFKADIARFAKAIETAKIPKLD